MVEDAAVPRSAQFMNIDDQEGNQMWRVVVMSSKLDDFITAGRKAGYNFKKFVYDYEKYKKDQEERTKLEQRHEFLKVIYSNN